MPTKKTSQTTKQKPQFMCIYLCEKCKMDSGYTELDKPVCRFCDRPTTMTLVSKKELSAEVLAERLKQTTDRMMQNLTGAYEAFDEDDFEKDEDFDPEKTLFELMAKAKKLRDAVHNLDTKESEKKQETKKGMGKRKE
ncbi:MAG: hypothetical protein KGZ58_01990 [Ignavibacteriales bacterium]|nr:hypothetical protein [Ignavibacteriales bacterium]